MIWFIIGFIVAAIIIVGIWREDLYDCGGNIGASVMTFIFSAFVTVIVWLIASGITSHCVEIKYDIVSDREIIALKDSHSVDGSYYIVGCYIENDLYYYYAAETELGYKTEKIRADNAYIKYTDGEIHIEKYKGKFANNIAYLFGICICNDRYIIYCPEGTIDNGFDVDFE